MLSVQMEIFSFRMSFLLFFLAVTLSLVNGYQFKVGGSSGWNLNPKELYGHWAERNRFQVNDTLYFKYDKNIDSVLVVNKDDYDHCNTAKPQLKLEGGESVFKFDRSGPFFFITSNVTNCQKGQKLIVVVLAVRHHSPSPPKNTPPASSPSDNGSAPSSDPSSTISPPSKSGGDAVFGYANVVFSAVCGLVGLSVMIF